MQQSKAGIQLSLRAFIQTALILFCLLIVAGVLTQVIPPGAFERVIEGNRVLIDPSSFHAIPKPDYPVWRWFTAPIEVIIAGPDRLLITIILSFILLMGISFAILDKSGILVTAIAGLVKKFGRNKYILLAVVTLFFMLLGSLFGIIEEALALIPIMITLSFMLGWDSLIGLGISFLALNTGFSAAILNPFTLGVVQNIAGLPVGSGAWFRIGIFAVFYALLLAFLIRYAKKIEKNPSASLVHKEEKDFREKYSRLPDHMLKNDSPEHRRASIFLVIFLILMLLILFSAPLLGELRDLALPLAALVFLIAGVGTGFLAGMKPKEVGKAALDGFLGLLPAVPLILLAVSPNYIAVTGGVMDSILHWASAGVGGLSPFVGVVIVYLIALVIEFFIGAASAKALLIMPILLPLGDLIGITRQTAALAYCFGDGFGNSFYPTGVLLIVLNLTVVSFTKWIRWTAKIWLVFILISIAALCLAVAIHYGPF